MLTRRNFIGGSAAALGMLATRRFARAALPKPEHAPFKHVVWVMMENRSFDHWLGWLPGADGRQAGLSYTDTNGVAHATYPLAPDFQGCGHLDPDHSFDGGRIEFDNGACDGWLRAANDLYAIGYYTQPDLPFFGKAARDWTICDRYFAPIMAPTYPNRMYSHCGVTDRLDDTLEPSTLPTIWDRLSAAGRVGRYYFSDLPFLGLWGPKYLDITNTYDQFVSDCAAGDLPDVAFVDPPLLGEDQGVSDDDHPHGDIRAGEHWLNGVYEAVTKSPNWKSTVMVVTFDEWGGFFDHVAPSSVPDVDPRFELRGFRVPALVVSPFARRGFISGETFDHTSVLKMIEWRWKLPALSVRDAQANNLADVLDFGLSKAAAAPQYSVPDVISLPCAL
jgi:phospholipase C